ncbi:MAG: metal ABC transporter substrate-binding protein [Anaerolineales bacterium]|jgi:ABC-type Zn uptake system ZnuABC Zn-binding protein ZnuA
MSDWHNAHFLQVLIICAAVLTGCSSGLSAGGSNDIASLTTPLADLKPVQLAGGEKLRLVITTDIVADVVQNVGGDEIEVVTLIPTGVDPHTFQASPADLRTMTEAHAIILNGAGLEEFLYQTLSQIPKEVPIISLSEGIELRQFSADQVSRAQDGEHAGTDPHVWFDPLNVMVWTDNSAQLLGTLDAQNRDAYAENAREYVEALVSLDEWIKQMVAEIPEQNRKLVTDHLAFGYFAQRYGFEMVGAVVPAYSTDAEPSARELADLNDKIKAQGIPALFVGITTNPQLTALIAQDTDVKLVSLYIGSLSKPGGPADTYIRFMQYDVNAIVQALAK